MNREQHRRPTVTGNTAGPSLYHLLEVLGKEKALARMERALEQFCNQYGACSSYNCSIEDFRRQS